MLAALLSVVLPGLGHTYLGFRRKGGVLLALLAALLIGFWPLRLLHFYFGFYLLYGGWIAVYVYAPISALLARRQPTSLTSSKWWLALFLPLSLVACEFLGIAVTRASGFKSFEVPSTSMERTIQKGDRIVADIWFYQFQTPAREDVIIFKHERTFFVKRVIAIAGDTIAGRNGLVVLNGQTLDEPFVEHRDVPSQPWLKTFGPITLSNEQYFVMGDNRDVSLDSRSPEIGLVDKKSIVGKALYVFASGRQGRRIK